MESKIMRNAKNAVIGFFILIFIMGFFSKSIINLFLPKVIVEPALEGTVVRSLNIEGAVEAKNTSQVRLPGEVIIEEFIVRAGDKVEAGKPLFRISKAYGLQGNAADVEKLKLQIEANRLRINNLQQGSDQVELKNIIAMETRLEKSKEELANQQILFDAGAISKQELDNYKAGIEQQELDIELARLQLDERKQQSLASVKELEGQIKGLQLQLQELEGKNEFYDTVDEAGICYSRVNGVVTGISQTQGILPKDTVIMEIAETGVDAGLIYTAQIMEEDYELVKEAGSIQVNAEDALKSEFLKISAIYKQGNNGLYRVEADIPKAAQSDGEEKYSVGQNLKGIVKQKYVVRGACRVSKSAVDIAGEYKVGSEGRVYLLEIVEGILGQEFRAKEVPVKLLAVGDDEVIVSELEKFEKPQVILNLSYKIKDGAKVFLWQ